ncbi:putative quinol monooxygenase [Pollutimonas harenae]|uniref:Antibiotic biosynthesis monooxygenase n=1 Tax=Pollutimonas harenae TaxID=657015 RepID=A0A853GWY1_9BURK|nr:antibiotic biosynthesis monooxygenase family protein [Pollutimonas harenae]NYT85256.1 antibiotic biosynthesis monooxygenase [Pollutimonas harenae]
MKSSLLKDCLIYMDKQMKKTLSHALSLAVVAALCLSSAARAQSAENFSEALDAAGYGLLVKLSIRPESRSDFLRIIKDRVTASRQRSEVVDFRVLATPDQHVFVAFESFRNEDAFKAFEKLPESQSFMNFLKPLLNGSPDVSILRPMP